MIISILTELMPMITMFFALVWFFALSVKYYDKVDVLCRRLFGFGLED